MGSLMTKMFCAASSVGSLFKKGGPSKEFQKCERSMKLLGIILPIAFGLCAVMMLLVGLRYTFGGCRKRKVKEET